MCYTSGTTGNPKGVVYSHRSTVLHSFGTMLADTLGRQRERHDHAGRPDVPRQRVGAVPGGRDGRLELRAPRPQHGAGRARLADGGGEGHAGRGRAHDLDGRHGRARRPRLLGPAADPVRRLGGPALAVGGLPREDRPPDAPGLGDDRDVAARVRVQDPQRVRRPRRGVQGRPARAPRASSPRSSTSASSSPRPTRSSRGTARRAASCSAPGPWIAAGLLRRRRRRAVHRRRLAADRRRGRDHPRRLHQARRPHQGPRQVRRRVDLAPSSWRTRSWPTRRSRRPR